MIVSVVILTTTVLAAVAENVVIQVDISPQQIITNNGTTKVIESKSSVKCSPPGLCHHSLQKNRFVLNTVAEVMKGLVKITSNCKDDDSLARIEAAPLARLEATTSTTEMTPWEEFKKEVRLSKKNRKKDRKAKKTSTTTQTPTTTTTTDEPSIETTVTEEFTTGRAEDIYREELTNSKEGSNDKEPGPDMEDTTTKEIPEETTPSSEENTTPSALTRSTTESIFSWWG